MSEENRACVEVNGWSVWFERFGSGPNPVLLIPGPIGSSNLLLCEVLI